MFFFSFKRSQGFTLIELMVALAVLGILLMIAVPSFRDVTASSSLRSCTTDLITSINTARADAVNLRQTVTLSADSGTGAWQSGWTLDYASGEDKSFAACKGGVAVVETADTDTFAFDVQGRTATALTFQICDGRDNEVGREITVSRLGLLANNNFAGCNGP